MNLLFYNNPLGYFSDLRGADLKTFVAQKLGISINEFYLTYNGRCLNDNSIPEGNVHVVLRTFGGKGGFGSMLRAIGAQIEKTTNREACRDLSGRRLRDINEEQRLKKWVAQQAEREKEAKEKKKKKLEKLCEQPKHEFNDQEYDKERAELPEKVEDAVLKGLEASCSSKRKSDDNGSTAKKKKKLWVDSDLDDELSSSEEESDNGNSEKVETGTKKTVGEKTTADVEETQSQDDVKNEAVEIEKVNQYAAS